MNSVKDYSTKTIVESFNCGCDGAMYLNQVTLHSYININNKFNLLIKNTTFLAEIVNGVEVCVSENNKHLGETYSTFVFYNNGEFIMLSMKFPTSESEVTEYIKDMTNHIYKFKTSYIIEHNEDSKDINSRFIVTIKNTELSQDTIGTDIMYLRKFIEKLLFTTGVEDLKDIIKLLKIGSNETNYLKDIFNFFTIRGTHPKTFYVKPKFKYDMEYWCDYEEDSPGKYEWTNKDDEDGEDWFNHFEDRKNMNKRVYKGIIRI